MITIKVSLLIFLALFIINVTGNGHIIQMRGKIFTEKIFNIDTGNNGDTDSAYILNRIESTLQAAGCAVNGTDFSGLNTGVDLTGSDAIYTYTARICGSISPSVGCGANVSLCASSPGYTAVYTAWQGDNTYNTYSIVNNALTLTSINGQPSPHCNPRTVQYTIQCGASSNSIQPGMAANCIFSFAVTLAVPQSACQGSTPQSGNLPYNQETTLSLLPKTPKLFYDILPASNPSKKVFYVLNVDSPNNQAVSISISSNNQILWAGLLSNGVTEVPFVLTSSPQTVNIAFESDSIINTLYVYPTIISQQ